MVGAWAVGPRSEVTFSTLLEAHCSCAILWEVLARREQADSGTEAALASSSNSTDDAAIVILERLGFPRSRHRTQVACLLRAWHRPVWMLWC